MPSTAISGAITVPEDEGTDLPSGTSDWTSAGHIGALIGENFSDYVERGFTITPDWANDAITVSAGQAYVFHDEPVDVQDTDGNYSIQWDDGMTMNAAVPEVTGVSIPTSGTAGVWLSLVLTENDAANYVVRDPSDPPAKPYIRIGTLDIDAQEVEHTNRSGPDASFLSAAIRRVLREGDSIEIGADESQVLSGPFEAEGSANIDGTLDVLPDHVAPRDHTHRGRNNHALTSAVQSRVEEHQVAEIPEGHQHIVYGEYEIAGEVELGGELVIL